MSRFVAPVEIGADELAKLVEPFGHKFMWFERTGYRPHLYQILFHTPRNPETGKLTRFRHLTAGRRGGKTKAAARESIYYLQHPLQWHLDFHEKDNDDEPLWVWEISRNYKEGRPAWLTFLKELRATDLVKDKDYKVNRSERYVEFKNDSLIEFRSAEDEDSLRGAGLDFVWFDEAGFVPSAGPYSVVRPALSDKEGGLITTSTPKGKNWLWETFWSDKALDDPNQMRVEYWSIHNPHFPRSEWEYVKDNYHPLLFKQEYMAAWDAMAGVELDGGWLHYYNYADLPRRVDGRLDLDLYLGVDPAVSTRDDADHFAMALIGITKDRSQVYLLDTYLGRIPFPDQVPLITNWQSRPGLQPMLTGIEANAYQAALSQQVLRVTGFPQTIPQYSKGKKEDRIMSMSVLFKLGKVQILESHKDFIAQWIAYDSSLKNPKDDLLDAVEIALRTAGAILDITGIDDEAQEREQRARDNGPSSMEALAAQDIARLKRRESADIAPYDPELGDFD